MDTTQRVTAEEYRRMVKQSEGKPADDKQRLRNTISSQRGRDFETAILQGCEYYKSIGRAAINKVNEPYIVTKRMDKGYFVGRHTGKAEPDFKGVLKGGRAVAFEAKSTQKSRIQKSALTPAQSDWLTEQDTLGAYTFVAVNIRDKCYNIPFIIWDRMKEIYDKKYLMPDDIKEYEVDYDGSTVKFLDYTEKVKRI